MSIERLVQDVVDLTGAPPPELLADDAPVLQPDVDQSLYFVGIIGGKDVGKSSLVNALVGQTITQPSSHGPGTEQAIAYAHADAEPRLRQQLSRIAPDAFRIVTHRIDALATQVLLDLPDIDSLHGHHLELVRKMLRHMLHPVWLQSIEKYADRQPQELLRQVAQGNDPSNFLFCLNKIDQLVAREGLPAVDELRHDYASRITRVLELPEPPRVLMVSATHPDQFDLPQLSALLSKARQPRQVRAAIERAGERRDRTLLKWIDSQNLDEQLQRLKRLLHEARELADHTIAQPLIEEALPRWAEDPAHRAALVEPAICARIARWPIVNMLDTVLHPLVALVQRNLSSVGTAPAPLDAYLADGGRSVRSLVQGTFAALQGQHPVISKLYRHQHLWDEPAADAAVTDLRRRLHNTVVRQRQRLADRLSGSALSAILAPWRWLLTIGALLWFPFVQPLVFSAMNAGRWTWSWDMLKTLVALISVTHLLQCAIFLLLWFAILWVVLRWMAQRRAARLLERWSRCELDPELSLPAQVMLWIDDLLEPLRAEHEQYERVVKKVSQAKANLR